MFGDYASMCLWMLWMPLSMDAMDAFGTPPPGGRFYSQQLYSRHWDADS